MLADIARRQPVVLVLDDLHWADKPTLLMLRQIIRSADDAPLLIVASFRDTERPDDSSTRSRSFGASTSSSGSRCVAWRRATQRP